MCRRIQSAIVKGVTFILFHKVDATLKNVLIFTQYYTLAYIYEPFNYNAQSAVGLYILWAKMKRDVYNTILYKHCKHKKKSDILVK